MCPNCGASVEFKSAASQLAVCDFCRSTLRRSGDELERIGQMAELFDDHSPLQLGVQGTIAKPMTVSPPAGEAADDLRLAGPFSIIGRLQYRYGDGVWNEWHLLLADGDRGWLSEDNGSYALMREAGERRDLPAPERFQIGQNLRLEGRQYQIASIVQAQLIAAAGELPFAPALNQPFWLVDTRSADARIMTLDYSTLGTSGADSATSARVYVGIPITLGGLALSGLKEDNTKSLTGKSLSCPNCGVALEVKLDGSKSVTCPSCASLVDLTRAEDGKPVFTRQVTRYVSPIPLGTEGTVEGVQWQAVGFARRSGLDSDGERFNWAEVLLYHRTEGFAFVVVANDGVSFVRPVQDVPSGPAWNSVRYRNRQYKGEPNYQSVVDYVEGEFYWQVRVGQQTRHVDYSSGELLLSREESVSKDAREVVWSHGKKYPVQVLAKAFGLPDISLLTVFRANDGSSDGIGGNAGSGGDGSRSASGQRLDQGASSGSLAQGGLAAGALGSANNAAPTSGSLGTWIVIIVVIILIIWLISAVDGCSSTGGGGSYSGSGRGYSGGSHK